MSFVHSFTRVLPFPRYDDTPWAAVFVEEAPPGTGGVFAQVDEQPLPADLTPETPDPIDLTVETATLPEGLYRFRFADAAGNLSPYTDAVNSPATGLLPDWNPTVEDVAEVTPAYTRGGFDDDEPQAGAERGTYDETTSPTAAEVGALIVAACEEVAGRVGVAIPVRCYGLARITARWHAAAQIAAGKRPAGTDDADGEWSGHISNYRASLNELIAQARIGATRLS